MRIIKSKRYKGRYIKEQLVTFKVFGYPSKRYKAMVLLQQGETIEQVLKEASLNTAYDIEKEDQNP